MNALKSLAGGSVSVLNGQFYNGGEFMPIHGLFCGKKGAARLTKWQSAATRNRAVDLGGSKMFEVTEYRGNGSWDIVGYAIADTHKQAEAAFTAKTKLYAKQV